MINRNANRLNCVLWRYPTTSKRIRGSGAILTDVGGQSRVPLYVCGTTTALTVY